MLFYTLRTLALRLALWEAGCNIARYRYGLCIIFSAYGVTGERRPSPRPPRGSNRARLSPIGTHAGSCTIWYWFVSTLKWKSLICCKLSCCLSQCWNTNPQYVASSLVFQFNVEINICSISQALLLLSSTLKSTNLQYIAGRLRDPPRGSNRARLSDRYAR